MGIDLEALVRDELLAQTSVSGQIEIEGPAVSLPAKAAEVLSLAVHELTTNAVKYGALASAQGSLRVGRALAEVDGEGVLTLRWTESGRPSGPVAPPPRKGFGNELIERHIPYELNGEGRLELLPDGMEAVISFPLRPGDSILQTDANSARVAHGQRT